MLEHCTYFHQFTGAYGVAADRHQSSCYPCPLRIRPHCFWPEPSLSLSALCGLVWQREGINVARLSWAALSAQQQAGDWYSSQRQGWALHCAGKLKGKRLPASISCGERRGRKGASSPPAVAAAGFLSQEVQLPPPSFPLRAVWKGKMRRKLIQSWTVRSL